MLPVPCPVPHPAFPGPTAGPGEAACPGPEATTHRRVTGGSGDARLWNKQPLFPVLPARATEDVSRLNVSSSQLRMLFKGKFYKMPVHKEITVGFQKK